MAITCQLRKTRKKTTQTIHHPRGAVGDARAELDVPHLGLPSFTLIFYHYTCKSYKIFYIYIIKNHPTHAITYANYSLILYKKLDLFEFLYQLLYILTSRENSFKALICEIFVSLEDSLTILSLFCKAQVVKSEPDSFQTCLQYVRCRYKERIDSSERALIVPITVAFRRRKVSYPFKLTELINQLIQRNLVFVRVSYETSDSDVRIITLDTYQQCNQDFSLE